MTEGEGTSFQGRRLRLARFAWLGANQVLPGRVGRETVHLLTHHFHLQAAKNGAMRARYARYKVGGKSETTGNVILAGRPGLKHNILQNFEIVL